MGGLRAEDISTILVGLSLFVAWLWGGSKGRQIAQGRSSSPPENVVEVAGAIVSDKAVQTWTASTDANTAAMAKLAKALDRNTEVCRDMHDAVKDATDEMRDLTKEVYAQTRSRRD